MHAYVKKHAASAGITVKHYLVSSGLTEIIEGTKIYKHFANVFASEYWFDAYDLPFPKRVITDTGKTQYLFRINKGIEDLGESINEHMPEDAAADPVRQHDLLRRRRHRRAVHGAVEEERRPRHRRARPKRKRRQMRRPVQGRPLRFLRAAPTTATARTCSSARACCSTASSRTSA